MKSSVCIIYVLVLFWGCDKRKVGIDLFQNSNFLIKSNINVSSDLIYVENISSPPEYLSHPSLQDAISSFIVFKLSKTGYDADTIRVSFLLTKESNLVRVNDYYGAKKTNTLIAYSKSKYLTKYIEYIIENFDEKEVYVYNAALEALKENMNLQISTDFLHLIWKITIESEIKAAADNRKLFSLLFFVLLSNQKENGAYLKHINNLYNIIWDEDLYETYKDMIVNGS